MTEDPTNYSKTATQLIPVADLIPTLDNKRIIHEGDETVKTLAQSIKVHGLLSPVLARPHPDQKDKYDLRAGARRLAAVKLLGYRTIATIVHAWPDADARLVTIAENMEREDLTPFEESDAVQALLDLGWGTKEVAAALNQSTQFVVRRAVLRKLIPELRELPENDERYALWPAAYWERLAALPAELQHEIFDEGRGDLFWEVTTVTNLEEYIASYTNQLIRAPFDLADAGLIPEVGECSACTKRTSVQPGLFDIDFEESPFGVTKKDRCLDATCWQNKCEALIQRRAAEIKTEHGDVQLVAANTFEKPAGTVSRHTMEKCKKGDPGAKRCLSLDGTNAGKSYWARPSGGSGSTASAGRPVAPATLATRREQLNLRREALVNRLLRESLEKLSYKNSGLTTDKLIRLAAAFGTLQQNTEPTDREGTGSSWLLYTNTDKLINTESTLWNAVRDTLSARLCYSGPLCNVPIKEHVELCVHFSMLHLAGLREKAAAEIPEPKGWANLNNDGTPKGHDTTTTKKKPKTEKSPKTKKKAAKKKAKAPK